MIKEKEAEYQSARQLKIDLLGILKNKKYRLDCGHHVTLGHPFGNDITIQNGTKLTIICSMCGH